MKKKIVMLCLALACLLVLAGCGCDHVWLDANCVDPMTCSECGETEGEALGHSWVDADCVNPKTCSACGETEGEALGHSWVDADCVNPKTCSACGETEGEALGHTWVDATTEAPKTCSTCSETEGERIITDARFTTAEAEPFFGSWKGEMVIAGDMLSLFGMEGMDAEIPITMTYTFGNAGDISILVEFSDWDAYMEVLHQYTVELLYAEFEALGMDKEETDEAMVEAYGLTTEEYVTAALSTMKPEDANSTSQMVYYVENGILYTANSWDEEMYQETYTWDNGTLLLVVEGYGEQALTRVEE